MQCSDKYGALHGKAELAPFQHLFQYSIDAKPLLVAVAFAASTSFATPISYQTNTMVFTAGGYRFSDFVRIGLPLNVIFCTAAILLIPRFFPF